MSAPLVVNTRDGVCWTRRAVTSGGMALYAPESVKSCPEFAMATIDELAEQGIVGSADVLPMPVAPAPQQRGVLDRAREAAGARMSKDALRLVLENVITYAAELEAQRDRRRARLVALQNDAMDMRGSLAPNGEARKVPFELGETLTPAVDWLIGRVAELEAARAAVPPPAPPAGTVRIIADVTNTEDRGDARCAESRVEYALEEYGYEARVWLDTDGTGFFQPGHAYTHRPGPDSPGGPRLRFYCETVTTDKATGQPVARGWGGRRYGDRWTSVQRAHGLEDWQSGAWADTTTGGDA